MADTNERSTTPRKAPPLTPKPDTKAAAPRNSSDTRRRIAEAAYYKAKERGFEPGHELEDWVEAESEVMGRINDADR